MFAGRSLMAVVKAGAYGHGLEPLANFLNEQAADLAFFGVANVGEARRIRAAGIETPIYILGPSLANERAEIVAQRWTACLSSLEEAHDFNRLAGATGQKLAVQIALDTGMGRGGFTPETLSAGWSELVALPFLSIEGIGSHLPSADEDEEFTRQQFAQFREIVDLLQTTHPFRWVHLANSAGLLGYPPANCNLARPGLMLYGISPLRDQQSRLRPVMKLMSRVTLIRTLPAGHGVSYGREFVTARPTRVATVGIGYGDGYPRRVSGNHADVWIRGARFPIIGRVTMDQLLVDVTDGEVSEGDEVEVFGPNILASEVAEKAGMITWEIFTGIAPRVVRIYREPSLGSP